MKRYRQDLCGLEICGQAWGQIDARFPDPYYTQQPIVRIEISPGVKEDVVLDILSRTLEGLERHWAGEPFGEIKTKHGDPEKHPNGVCPECGKELSYVDILVGPYVEDWYCCHEQKIMSFSGSGRFHGSDEEAEIAPCLCHPDRSGGSFCESAGNYLESGRLLRGWLRYNLQSQ